MLFMLWLSSAAEKAVGTGMRCPETHQGAALDPTIHCCSPLVWLVGSQWSGRARWGGTAGAWGVESRRKSVWAGSNSVCRGLDLEKSQYGWRVKVV